MNPPTRKSALMLLACVVAGVVFLLDLNVALGVAAAVPYVLVVWLVSVAGNRRGVWWAAGVCSLLALLGWALSPLGGELWQVLINRALAIFAIWLIAALLANARKLMDELRCKADDAQSAADQLKRLREEERKQSRAMANVMEDLRIEREKLHERIGALLNSTAEGIYGLDLDGNCTFANAACAELLGYASPAEFIGRNMHELIHHA